MNDKHGLASTYCNLSLVLFDIGKIDDAKDHLNKGLELFKKMGIDRAIEIGNFEMSKFLHFEDDYISGIDILNSAIKYFKEIDDTIYLLRSLIQLGIHQRLNKQLKESAKTLNEALEIANKINHDIFIKTINIELAICDIKNSKNLLEKYIAGGRSAITYFVFSDIDNIILAVLP